MKDRDMRIIIGSVHKEEEDYLVPALVQLMNENPDLKVLYALHEPTDSALREIKKNFIITVSWEQFSGKRQI